MSARKSKLPAIPPAVSISGEVLRQIRQHARSSSKTEVCGVLIGGDGDSGASSGKVKIDACIPGLNAAQAGTHVTFTQDTWEHIYKIKDSKYPDARIVGWYHSHPGFGVFLSDHDTFIHKNFFSNPLQVAWVYDPHSDEEGCFGWVAERLERLPGISVADDKGGEGAGETGKPEPIAPDDREEPQQENSSRTGDDSASPWPRKLLSVLTHLVLFAAGFFLAWYIGPRVLLIPVDPRTMQQVGSPIDIREVQRELREREATPRNSVNSSSGPASSNDNAKENNKENSNGHAAVPDRSNNADQPDQLKDPHAP
jgi:proteasome lid subunit RPN8/RPN11